MSVQYVGSELHGRASIAPPSALHELERRRDGPRMPTNDPASMIQLNPLRTTRSEIRVLDVSKGGLKLQLPEAVDIGTVVHIRMKHLLVTAEVRYCVAASGGFSAGVQIQDIFPRSAAAST